MAHLAVRVNLRLDAAEKASIDRAAELLGVHTSTFARQAVLRETERVLAADSAVELGPQESRRFLAALDDPSEPVRWWAAQGCTILGAQAGPAEAALRQRLTDVSGASAAAHNRAASRLQATARRTSPRASPRRRTVRR